MAAIIDEIQMDDRMTFYTVGGIELTESQFQTVDKEIETKHIILTTGEFNQNGNEFEVTLAHLESMVKNFRDRVLGTEPPIDFSHNAEQLAAGWITDLKLSTDKTQLIAQIKWTLAGLKAIKAKEFRYFSPSFTFDFFDGSTGARHGPTLRGGALTNIPFLRHLPPIVDLSQKLSDQKGAKKMDKNETISLADHNAAIKIMATKNDELSNSVKDLSEKLDGLVNLQEEHDKLKKDLADKQAAIELAEKEKKFDSFLAKGIVQNSQREAYIKGDIDALIENAPKKLNLSSKGAPPTPNGEDEVTFDSLPKEEKEMYNVYLSEKMTKEQYVQSSQGKGFPKQN